MQRSHLQNEKLFVPAFFLGGKGGAENDVLVVVALFVDLVATLGLGLGLAEEKESLPKALLSKKWSNFPFPMLFSSPLKIG